MLRSHVQGKRVLLITNDRIAPMYLDRYQKLLDSEGDIQVDTVVLPDGEEHKTFECMSMILDRALELGLDRKSTFVALGGGVIGDMVGFASAIYQRGVNFIQVCVSKFIWFVTLSQMKLEDKLYCLLLRIILAAIYTICMYLIMICIFVSIHWCHDVICTQIPTTVMAMVDSSVGGKTGVNHPLGKNMIGSFHQPQCVLIDTTVLDTLPDRELKSGLSEVVKYGLIRDSPFFKWQEENMDKLLQRDRDATRYAIKRSCENKSEVVKADEKEAGVRATLNLGHTFGHAIENGSGYGTWLHGEGVSIGTAMAATMSEKMGWIDADLKKRIYDILEAADLPIKLPKESPMTVETFNKLMSLDKKVADGQLRLILLRGELGNCVFTGEFDTDAMQETIEEFVKEIDA